ncbi:peroxidase 1-like [Hordeum vulgare subsp. vulgare]|uniref:Peroxidase n=1 Tax=Hordeum vulgare subsp. vulgare TaxID=112509 RepID=A0A8I6YTL7_HORVV|nr:peroxidase 1-like [Hordeum vulgare subsp. vulgare]
MAIRSLLLPLALLVLAASSAAVAELKIGFYTNTCPDAEKIVREEMAKIIAAAPSLAGPLLRLHFHDCFVRGCDASVLLESTDGNVAEKDAKPNKSLRGFGSVERVKAKLEAACPGIVSCADVLTLMSRDAVVLAKGPFWPVALGRRDGRVSSAIEASNELPPASGDVPLLAKIFASKGLDLKDLVVLSGAHTLGTAHCPSFADRLYNNTGGNGTYGLVDPSLDSNYADKLRLKCKSVDDRTMLSEMDPGSFKTFDTSYYRHVAKRRGLFRSDAALLFDDTTKDYVQRIATGKFDDEFFKDFSASMIKMGDVGVLTGAEGEIRKKCYAPN